MALPIVQPADDAQHLLRLYLRTEQHWTEHLAQRFELPIGTAYSSRELPDVHMANNMQDVALPAGMSPAAAMELAEQHFREQRTRCAIWTMNPSSPPEATVPIVEHLLKSGHVAESGAIMRLGHARGLASADVAGISIIPARASYRHAGQIARDAASRWPGVEEQLAEARMRRLDDPHWDCLLALHEGEAVAMAGVLAVGDVGRIDAVHVAQPWRGKGIGRMLMSRLIELCARAMFRHVLLHADPTYEPAVRLYRGLGFETVAELVQYRAPS